MSRYLALSTVILEQPLLAVTMLLSSFSLCWSDRIVTNLPNIAPQAANF